MKNMKVSWISTRKSTSLCVRCASSFSRPLLPRSQQIDAGDSHTLDSLLPANSGERKTLADLIFAKLDNVNSNSAVIKPSEGD